jgi:hypothetical protein
MRCGLFDSRFKELNVASRSENILDFMNMNNMSLGALAPLHVYVKHGVELMEEIAAPESDGPQLLSA